VAARLLLTIPNVELSHDSASADGSDVAGHQATSMLARTAMRACLCLHAVPSERALCSADFAQINFWGAVRWAVMDWASLLSRADADRELVTRCGPSRLLRPLLKAR
jgi:hypothetical protein